MVMQFWIAVVRSRTCEHGIRASRLTLLLAVLQLIPGMELHALFFSAWR